MHSRLTSEVLCVPKAGLEFLILLPRIPKSELTGGHPISAQKSILIKSLRNTVYTWDLSNALQNKKDSFTNYN